MSRRGRVLDALIYCLAAAVIGAGAAGVYDMVARPSTAAGLSVDSISGMFRQPLAGVDELRVMLIGSDDRKDDVGRADTLLLARINPKTKRATLLSFPRDLRVDIPGHGRDKINHAYAYGGIPLVKRCVEEVLGEPVDYYAHATFETFVKVVDLLGGVDIDVPDYDGKGRGMNYDCSGDNLVIYLKPGPQHLDGYKAMGFARYRKSNIPGHAITDTQRTHNQQMVLRALLEQKLRPSNGINVLRAASYVLRTIDTDMPWAVAADLARLMRSMDSDSLMTATIPVRDTEIGGVYYAELDEARFAEISDRMAAHLGGAKPPPPVIEVVANGAPPEASARVVGVLAVKGFAVREHEGERRSPPAKTTVEYAQGRVEVAQRTSKALGLGAERVKPTVSENMGGCDVRVNLGKDFQQALQR